MQAEGLAGPVSVLQERAKSPPWVVTAEHASQDFPPPYVLPESDAWMQSTHWAYDLGARELAMELAEATGTSAVLANFSRLLVDPNRSEASPDLFLRSAEGRELVLNRDLSSEEKEERLALFFRPFHQAVDRVLSGSTAPLVLSIHSFTPIWNGTRRDVELGVLFNREQSLAESAALALEATGLVIRPNEPYSGREGLIYSAEKHAESHGRRALELEVRQDLAMDGLVRRRVVEALSAWATGDDFRRALRES